MLDNTTELDDYRGVIESFACRQTKAMFEGRPFKKLPHDLQRPALRKLTLLQNAKALDDLRVPPGNRMEALKGQRKGRHSIRVNDQYRIVFRWHSGKVHDVAIIDYH